MQLGLEVAGGGVLQSIHMLGSSDHGDYVGMWKACDDAVKCHHHIMAVVGYRICY